MRFSNPSKICPLILCLMLNLSATGTPRFRGAAFCMKEIKLSSSKYGELFAQVDDEDFEYLNQFKWFPHNRGTLKKPFLYAIKGKRINGKQIMISMHRVIMNVDSVGILIDHRDHNTLNNQKYNLRKATKTQNQTNRTSMIGGTSEYLGVSLRKDTNKWTARIQTKNKYKSLGCFYSEKEAAYAYNEAAKIVHGEFANLNKL